MRELEARRVEGRGVRSGSTSVNVRKEARKRKREGGEGGREEGGEESRRKKEEKRDKG